MNSGGYRVRQKFLTEIEFPPPPKIIPERKIIASLTSWTKRIGTAHLAVQTILNQTRQPDLTVLYLFEGDFPQRENDLPKELLALRSERFEIRWYKNNLRPALKLIPALKDFPDDIIITFDDDLFYPDAVIERLLNGYKKHPEMIQAHRVTNVIFDATGNIKLSNQIPFDCPSYIHKITSVASCLYAPSLFNEEVLNERAFLRLSPTNDDVWFWAMAILNGRRVNVVENNIDTLNYIPGTQHVGLSITNDGEQQLTLKCIENVLNAYPVLREILRYEQRLANGG